MDYIKQWEQQFNKRICKDYQYHLSLFSKEATFCLLKATYQDILNYINVRRDLGDSLFMLKNKVSSIKKYYQCLVELKVIAQHPCKYLVLKDKYESRIDLTILYSENELNTFLIRKGKFGKLLEKRNQVIRLFLVYQALKVQEISNLKITDLDLDNAFLHIKDSRSLALNPKQIIVLYRYLNEYRTLLLKGKQSAILLPSFNGNPLNMEHISHIVNRDFVKKLKPKIIRQSVIYHQLKKGKDLRSVQLFAGHKSVISTEKYRNTNFEQLKSQLQLHHPLNDIR